MKVSQVKAKVAAKVAKGKAKVAAKCGKAAKCAVLLFGLAFVLAGCQNPAQRAQTAETRLVFNINEGASGTTFNFGNEFVSLAQSNETGGNDAGQTASPVTDIRPDIDVSVPVNKANAGTSGAAGGALERVVGSAADWVADKISGGDKDAPAAAAPAATPAAAADSSCPNGNCSPGGSCPNGSCAPPEQ